MKSKYFALGLVVAISLAGCGAGTPAILGKWKCVNPDGASFNTIEYLADGTQLSTFEYISKPPDMSDTEWQIKKGDKRSSNATWKTLEGDRLQITRDCKSTVTNYKIDGKSFQFDPPSGVKCEKV